MKSIEQQPHTDIQPSSQQDTDPLNTIPIKYQDLPSEVVEELLKQLPILYNNEKDRAESERRAAILSAVKKVENEREERKQQEYIERYKRLSDRERTEFPSAQQRAVKMLIEHIQGKASIDNLLREEEFLMNTLISGYKEFIEENSADQSPDASHQESRQKEFTVKFSVGINQTIYENLVGRLALKVLREVSEAKEEQASQEQADIIRMELGVPTQYMAGGDDRKPVEENSEQGNIDMPEPSEPLGRIEESPEQRDRYKKELEDTYNKIGLQRRMTLQEDLFLVGHGINPDTEEKFDTTGGEIGQFFDAHGIAKGDQIKKLLSILETGIDKARAFYTAPFELPDVMRAAGSALGTSGGTAYKDGIAVLTSGYKKSLLEDGIKHIFINDVYTGLVKPLSKLFPQYEIHLLSEQKRVMEKEAEKHNVSPDVPSEKAKK